MAKKRFSISGVKEWWQNRIIRTKILIGLFVGVFAYQAVSTSYQMQKVENDILLTYHEKALNLSTAIDCIQLKDGILFFNLLDRIGRTEVVGIKIDEDHPSCVEREAYLGRLKTSFFNEFSRLHLDETSPQEETASIIEDFDAEEITEIIIEEDDAGQEQARTPQTLSFDLDSITGTMEATKIIVDGVDKSQLLYSVMVNGIEVTFDLTSLPEKKLERFLTLTLTALGTLLLLFVIIWFLTGQIVAPLKTLTDFTQTVIKSGAIQKGESITLVRNPAKDEIGILTRAFNQMIARLQKSYRQIIKSKAAIGDLLDNTGQGFFSFGPDYLIHEDYSKACDLFFDHRIAGRDAMDLLVPDNKTEVKQLTDLLFNKVGDLDLLQDMLPKEIELSGRILAMEYRYIPAISKEIDDKMMVILTDVTQERELEKQLQKDEEINELIIRIARDKDGFIQFVQDTDSLLMRIQTELNRENPSRDTTVLMRHFHTIKGVSASYGLLRMSEKAHEIEEIIQNYVQADKEGKQVRFPDLGGPINQMNYVLRSSLDDVQDIITWEEIDQNRERTYRISGKKLAHLEKLLTGSDKISLEAVKNEIDGLKKQPIKPVFKKFAVVAKNLAEKLGKEVEVIQRGTNVEVPFEKLDPLFDAMIHLVRNSVDHGLEDPETRVGLGKKVAGQLVLEARSEAGKTILIVSDNGAGINPEIVTKIATRKGIITAEKAKHLNQEDAVKLIFEPGFSTADNVSDISGRGVGMDAVKSVISEIGGTISVNTALNKGTSFVLTIPV